jgi:hypothetical protein
VAQLAEALGYTPEGLRFYSRFFIELIIPLHYGPGVFSASNINEYQRYLLGGGGGVVKTAGV